MRVLTANGGQVFIRGLVTPRVVQLVRGEAARSYRRSVDGGPMARVMREHPELIGEVEVALSLWNREFCPICEGTDVAVVDLPHGRVGCSCACGGGKLLASAILEGFFQPDIDDGRDAPPEGWR